MKIKTSPVRVKAGPDDGLKEGEFLVYPSTFTRTPDAYGDVVAKGAFLDSLKAWEDAGKVIPGLFGHRLDDPDYYVAGATETGEDDHGWWVKGLFDLDSPKGPQVYRLVKSKRLNELSFAYSTLDEGMVELDDGTEANELRKLDVFEFSFVPVGANRETSIVAVKATTDALIESVKAGRVLAAKHITSLRKAQEAIGVVIAAAEEIDQEKASGTGAANDEEPESAKSDELTPNPSARALAELSILSL